MNDKDFRENYETPVELDPTAPKSWLFLGQPHAPCKRGTEELRAHQHLCQAESSNRTKPHAWKREKVRKYTGGKGCQREGQRAMATDLLLLPACVSSEVLMNFLAI